MLFIFLSFFVSCSKDEKIPTQQQKTQQEDVDNPADTNLTPEEKFSSSIMMDFLNDSDDEDLADFLESEIYKMGANYKGASVVQIYPAVWFVMLEKDGKTKNYLLQKFVDLKTNEYYFNLRETQLNMTDIISRKGSKTAAGE